MNKQVLITWEAISAIEFKIYPSILVWRQIFRPADENDTLDHIMQNFSGICINDSL